MFLEYMAPRTVYVTYQFKLMYQWAEVKCGGCGWRVILPGESIDRLFPRPTLLREAEKRFRCRMCGQRKAALRAVSGREYHG